MRTFIPKGNVYGPILPAFVLKMPLSLGAKVMYALLCNYASEKDHCWPSHSTLATRLACSVSSVKNYLRELSRENLIAIQRGQRCSSIYYMLRPDMRPKACSDSQVSNTIYQETDFNSTQSKSGYLNNLNKQFKEKASPLPPTGHVPDTPVLSRKEPVGGIPHTHDFEKAWELYPKKEGKRLAAIAWEKLRASGELPPMHVIHTAITQSIAFDSWQRENGRFIPQMSNWLRGQRWLDEHATAEHSSHEQSSAEKSTSPEKEKSQQALKKLELHKQLKRQQELSTREKLRPLFDALLTKFPKPANTAMAFGRWLYLYSKGIAPLAEHVPTHTTSSVMEFIQEHQKQQDFATYRAAHAQQYQVIPTLFNQTCIEPMAV